jgi:hypothetical protein
MRKLPNDAAQSSASDSANKEFVGNPEEAIRQPTADEAETTWQRLQLLELRAVSSHADIDLLEMALRVESSRENDDQQTSWTRIQGHLQYLMATVGAHSKQSAVQSLAESASTSSTVCTTISMHDLVLKGSVFAFGSAVLSVLLWSTTGIVLINPLLSVLTIIAAPFFFVMGLRMARQLERPRPREKQRPVGADSSEKSRSYELDEVGDQYKAA